MTDEALQHAVVRYGERFETALLASFDASNVELTGGWAEAGFSATTTLWIEDLELEVHVVHSARGRVLLRPLLGGQWPHPVLRALGRLSRK